MAKIISLINLKGGVGKTTLTIALADFLSVEHKKKVLVIDLDPQTNATVSLIAQERWKEVNQNNNTLHQLYWDKINNENVFNLKNSILKNVGNLKTEGRIDLIPSSIDLIDIVEDIIKIDNEKEKLELLDKEINNIKEEYDYIFIDCPPDLSAITMTGLYASQQYLIPVIADTLSVYGLNQLITKISNKIRSMKRIKPGYECIPTGIVINRYTGTKGQENIKEALEARASSRNRDLPKIFKVNIKALDKISRISENVEDKTTIKEKYKNGYENLKEWIDEFINEV